MKDGKYDFVVVGAGSAGCVLASRLTEDPDASVLLLEAGGWDTDPWIHIPLGFGKIYAERRHDWMYTTHPGSDCAVSDFPRGKVIGGTSSINAMAYVRGHRADFDRWAAAGLPSWSFANVLPYFLRQETWTGEPSEYRGTNGPLKTRASRFADPLVDAYLEAAVSAGHALTRDYNGAQQEGFGLLQSTIGSDGRRCSSAVAYLHPALKRPNLTVQVGASASRIILDRGRATGVEYFCGNNELKRVAAEREVIVASGVVNSPQLLMLSGIGDPDALSEHDIKAAVPLRGVGQNLRDHLGVSIEYTRKTPGPFQKMLRLDRLGFELAKGAILGRGMTTDLPGGWTAFVKSCPDSAIPDTQFIFRASAMDAGPYLPPFRRGFSDGFACRPILLRPESSGSISLASSDPAVAPRISEQPLETERDRKTLRNAVRMAHALGRERVLQDFIGSEVGPDYRSMPDHELDAYIRTSVQTFNHPLGTCRMGSSPDEGAVVDGELRVFGVEGLRVVDASIMPDQIGGNINAPVIMMAEIAADFVRGRPPLRPLSVAQE